MLRRINSDLVFLFLKILFDHISNKKIYENKINLETFCILLYVSHYTHWEVWKEKSWEEFGNDVKQNSYADFLKH